MSLPKALQCLWLALTFPSWVWHLWPATESQYNQGICQKIPPIGPQSLVLLPGPPQQPGQLLSSPARSFPNRKSTSWIGSDKPLPSQSQYPWPNPTSDSPFARALGRSYRLFTPWIKAFAPAGLTIWKHRGNIRQHQRLGGSSIPENSHEVTCTCTRDTWHFTLRQTLACMHPTLEMSHHQSMTHDILVSAGTITFGQTNHAFFQHWPWVITVTHCFAVGYWTLVHITLN